MVSGHHIRLIQVSNFLDLNIYAKTPWAWGPRVNTNIIGETFGEVLGPQRQTVSELRPAQKLGVKYLFPPDGPRGANRAPKSAKKIALDPPPPPLSVGCHGKRNCNIFNNISSLRQALRQAS